MLDTRVLLRWLRSLSVSMSVSSGARADSSRAQMLLLRWAAAV